MKTGKNFKLIGFAVGMICLMGCFNPPAASAQGTVYLSNLGQTVIGTNRIGYDGLFAGVEFVTGTNAAGYTLNSIQVLMATSVPGASYFNFVLGNSDGPPWQSYSFNGDSNPNVGGLYTYTPTSLATLLPNTDYEFEIQAMGSYSGQDYLWCYTDTASATVSSDGWSEIRTQGVGSTAGFPVFAISATAISPVPEPETWSLGAISLMIFLFKAPRALLFKRKNAIVPSRQV